MRYLFAFILVLIATIAQAQMGTVPLHVSPAFSPAPSLSGSLLPSPNDFTQAGWSSAAVTNTANNCAAPDGSMTASTSLSTTANSGHASGQPVISTVAPGYYRLQGWAKPINGYDVAMLIDNNTTNPRDTHYFPISTGGAITNPVTGLGIVVLNATMIPQLNGFYLITEDIAIATASVTVLRVGIHLGSGGNTTFVGNASDGACLWGWQMVAVPVPTLGVISSNPVPVIGAYEINTDVDDYDAIRYLANAAKAGNASLLAMVATSNSIANPTTAPALKALLNYSGLTTVPVGVYSGTDSPTNPASPSIIVRNTFRPGDVNSNYTDATIVLRQALASAVNNSVIVEAQGALNVWYFLLMSPSDGISALSGRDLVAQKVRRMVLCCGDYYTGSEYNFQLNPPYTTYVLTNWPTEIVGVGYNLGLNALASINPTEDTATSPYALGFQNAPPGYLVPVNGVTALAITSPGTLGTNGTFALGFSGNSCAGQAGTFTVAGGAVTAVKITSGGQNCTGAPIVSTSASSGLTGAIVTATEGSYNTRYSWGTISAYLGIEGVDTNFYYATLPSINIVDPSTGNNTVAQAYPGTGKETYLFKTISGIALGTLLDQGVW